MKPQDNPEFFAQILSEIRAFAEEKISREEKTLPPWERESRKGIFGYACAHALLRHSEIPMGAWEEWTDALEEATAEERKERDESEEFSHEPKIEKTERPKPPEKKTEPQLSFKLK